jgi:DNA-binding IclR family transcriptional regulator
LAYQPERVIAEIISRMTDEHGLLRALTERTIIDPEELRRDLERTRARGYAVAEGELEEELVAVAAPIFDHRGDVAATLSASGPSFRLTSERVTELGALVADTAIRLSEMLGYVG